MRQRLLKAGISTVVLITVLAGSVYAEPVAAWSEVDWSVVKEEIDGKRDTGENINVTTGVTMEVPAGILERLEGSKLTLAFHTGSGIAVSVTGTELRAPGYDLHITFTEENVIPENLLCSTAERTLYSRTFALNENSDYGVQLNIHFRVGGEYAGKYANLYYFDEQKKQVICQGSFVVTDNGMAMFSLLRGDEYLLTVTDELPAGGRTAYTVVRGDCLSRIASRNGISLRTLLKANPQITDANMIHPGEVITIVKQ